LNFNTSLVTLFSEDSVLWAGSTARLFSGVQSQLNSTDNYGARFYVRQSCGSSHSATPRGGPLGGVGVGGGRAGETFN